MQEPQIIPLHASACITPRGVLLFLGHAGAGKSTIAGLLAERFPTLADDAVHLIRDERGTWRVVDGGVAALVRPWQEGNLSRSDESQLWAVVRIYHGAAPKLERIGCRKACRHLTDALVEFFGRPCLDVAVVRSLFGLIAQVARCYPAWELHMSQDRRTSDLVFRMFG